MADQIEKGNVFDKIFRENVEQLFLPLIARELDIHIQSYVALKDKMQTTLEREMDFCYDILTVNGKRLILHIEFQSKADRGLLKNI